MNRCIIKEEQYDMTFRLMTAALVVIGGVLAGCGGASSEAGETSNAELEALGRQVYRRACITCHQAEGEGIPGVYPPLQQTAWTEGDKGRLIRLVLHGMEGPVEVKGQAYDQVMQPLGYLSDEQVAAVLTFVRQNFGNDAGAVAPQEVARVRAASTQEGRWQAEVLWARTGIPGTPTDSARAE